MLVSSEKEQISLPLEHSIESLRSSSNSDSLDEMLVPSDLSDSPQLTTVYTDVSVVPEQERNEVQQSILNLEGEIAQLKQKARNLDKKRGEALNKILDIKGSIRVFCRVRPFLTTDWRRLREPISVGEEKIVVRSVGSRRDFKFDKVFDAGAIQVIVKAFAMLQTYVEDVFVEVDPIMRSALDGHNVCILAYGQTGTGKTFTMDGTNEQPGIIPRALEVLFSLATLDNTSPVTMSISMLEVYMGNLKDLLAPKVACRSYETVSKCNLNIQTDQKGLVEIENLTEIEVPDLAKAKWWYARGRRARATSWTNVNEMSSRSHCLTRITISRHGDDLKAKKEVSKLWMVDLGGSERLLKTGATGQTLDEGRAINLSLSALGDVIAALRRKRGHVPYRNSKLTQILKDSLGASSKVVMLVHISPCEDDIGETVCSLSFANRARAVDTNRELAEDIKKQRQKRISLLEDDMREAEEEIQRVRDQIRKAEILLNENRKLFAVTYQPPEDKEETTPITPQEDAKEVCVTPQISDKGTRRNVIGFVPRFMTSTVASRQRQSAAESMIVARARSSRSVARTSVQFSCSQSLNYSDIRLKAMLRESNKKPRQGEWKNFPLESPKCNASDLKTSSLPQRKTVHSSDPNLKATLGRHRRRMSDLI